MGLKKNQQGIVRFIPLLLIVAVFGLISFLLFSSFAPFKGSLSYLFPKSASHAGISKDFGVNLSGGEFGAPGTVGVLGKDYLYYTDATVYSYFSQKGLKLLRIPFNWERVQPQALGALSSVDIAGLKSILDTAQATNTKVILDLHNFARYYGTPMTTADATQFADVWTKLAAQFKDHPALYGYELMNEPHDLPEGSSGWATLAQAATDAIRKVDTTHYVLVPGYGWQTARFWQDNNANLSIHDSANKLLYAAHQYFDGDYTGTYSKTYDADGAYPLIGADRVQPFLDWLAAKNVMGIMTEYGAPGTDARWLAVLDNFEQTINQNDHIVGGTYWSAGPWWGSYPLSLQPLGSAPSFSDQPQMAIVQKYPSTSASNGYVFGTVDSDDSHASAESASGIKLAIVQLGWDQYQPGEVSFNQTYIASLKQKIQNFRNARMQVVLDFGLQYPPSWVLNYPNSHFVNQYGHSYQSSGTGSGENPVNAVFNQTMRDKQENYIKQVFTDLGTDFYAVRLGWGNYGEVGFPGPSFQSDTNSYWAFDQIAQGGAGLPAGMTKDPVPGWIPGQSSTNHASAQAFLNWYLDSLKNYHDWQITMVNKYFSGKKAMLYPSWGIRPGKMQETINDDLNGSSGEESTGEVGKGLDFGRLINGISDSQTLVYGTWIDSPTNFGNNDTTSDQVGWSPIHYLAYLAQNKGLSVWGENTGNGDINAMNLSFNRMKQFGLIGLNWAFDKDLYTGGSLATLVNYQTLISQSGASPVPTSTPSVTATPTAVPSQTPIGGTLTLYKDALSSQFQNYAYGGNINFASTNNPYSGSNTIQMQVTASSFGVNLHTINPINISGLSTLTFAGRVDSPGARYEVVLYDGITQSSVPLANIGGDLTTSWKLYTVPLSQFSGIDMTSWQGINIKELSDSSGKNVFIDEISLSPQATPSPSPFLCQGADIDKNGTVNIFDYNQVVSDFGKSGSGLAGDINQDQTVNIFDYNFVVSNFGKTGC